MSLGKPFSYPMVHVALSSQLSVVSHHPPLPPDGMQVHHWVFPAFGNCTEIHLMLFGAKVCKDGNVELALEKELAKFFNFW